MDTEKYRILLKTIQAGSLSNAAEELGYTPSGVSRAISSLEEEADIVLLIGTAYNNFYPQLARLIYAFTR